MAVGLAERIVYSEATPRMFQTLSEASTSALSMTIEGRYFSFVLNGYLWLEG